MNKAMYLKNYISSLSWNYSRNRSFSYDDHLIWSFQQIKKKSIWKWIQYQFTIREKEKERKSIGKLLVKNPLTYGKLSTQQLEEKRIFNGHMLKVYH